MYRTIGIYIDKDSIIDTNRFDCSISVSKIKNHIINQMNDYPEGFIVKDKTLNDFLTGDDRFIFGRSQNIQYAKIIHSYDDAIKEVLADKIKKIGKCKISRPVFGFFSSTPNSWGITSFEEGDVISSSYELITLAKAEGYSEERVITEYKLGLLKIVPVLFHGYDFFICIFAIYSFHQ